MAPSIDIFTFFWVDKGIIGGSNLPTSQKHIRFLKELGLKHIISATAHEQVKSLLNGQDINHYALPILDFSIPTHEQIKDFIAYLKNCLEKKEAVVIHCYAGCGRTGLLLMIYLMIFKDMEYNQALQHLRSKRSCAVESPSQQKFLQHLDITNLKHLL